MPPTRRSHGVMGARSPVKAEAGDRNSLGPRIQEHYTTMEVARAVTPVSRKRRAEFDSQVLHQLIES